MAQVRVFEVDEPVTQGWKRTRLQEMGMSVPPNLHFVPIDFETGASWVEAITASGFDRARPTVIASTGVTQYISADALSSTLRDAAGLSPGTTFVSPFVLPQDRIDPGERELRRVTDVVASRQVVEIGQRALPVVERG